LNLTEFTKNTNNLPKWIYIFLRDEEKEANLIDFRTQWYGQNSTNKLIEFRVFLKTLHYLFIEVKLKEFVDKTIFSTFRIPRR
ncbi:hypothetical protein, partial [Hyella patelloides]|uniref:hypothetical protein n=1 Tax=Hyella patelloides TaxID=1982969 RepID=UPI001C983A01